MIFKKGELKLLWPFYLNYLIYGLSLMILPFMIIYFRELGFSFLQIMIIMTAPALGLVVFEIPTGALADSFSRKWSAVLGFMIVGISVFFIPFFTNFYLILPLWFLAGLGSSFVSGADEALVIDNLNHHRRKDLYHGFFVKSGSLAAIGAIISPLAGAAIVKLVAIKYLWFIFGGGFLLMSLVLTLFAAECFHHRKLRMKEVITQTIKQSKSGAKFLLSTKSLLFLVLGGMFTSFMFVGEGLQPMLVDLSMPVYSLGIFYSAMAGVQLIFPFFSVYFKKLRLRTALSLTTGIGMILLLSLLLISPPWYMIAIVVIMLTNGLRVINGPLFNTHAHHLIPNKIRATVLSARSMLTAVFASVYAIGMGYLLDLFGPQKVVALAGLFGILAIIMYWQIKEQH